VKYCDLARATGAHSPAPANQQKSHEPQAECIARGERVVQHDRARGYCRSETKAPSEHKGAGHLEVAQVAWSSRDREAQQQSRVRSHSLQRWHLHPHRDEKQSEGEGVD
jgi:hypothetical protein